MKYLKEKRNDLITRAEEILNTAKTEKRELSEDEAKEIAGIKDEVGRIDETLKMNTEVRALGNVGSEEEKEAEEEKKDEPSAEEMEERAFENFIRGRMIHERAGELSPASGSAGKTIPKSIANKIIKRVYDVCPVLEKSTKYNVKGTLEIPYYGDTAGGDKITVAYATEFQDLASHNGAFNTISLTGFLAGALSKISKSLINNSQFNIVDFVVTEMSDAISRFIEHELLIGTSGSVEGLSGLTNGITAAAQAAVTADEIIQLKDKVKDRYQNDAMWIMSSATRTALRLLKDDNKRYLLQDDITAPFGTTLLGKPVYVSDNMPDMAAGAKAIYYGDFSGLATKFNEDVNIEILRELYAAQHAVGVVGWFEFDSKVEDAQKLAVLTMHA